MVEELENILKANALKAIFKKPLIIQKFGLGNFACTIDIQDKVTYVASLRVFSVDCSRNYTGTYEV